MSNQSISARLQFARKLKSLRLAHGWSQEELAERAELHRNYVGAVERGERNVSIDNMEKIAQALNHPLAKFFEPSKNYLDDKCLDREEKN